MRFSRRRPDRPDDARARYAGTSAAAAGRAPAGPPRTVVALVAVTLVIGGTAAAAAGGRLPGPARDAIAGVLEGVGVSIPHDDDNAPRSSGSSAI